MNFNKFDDIDHLPLRVFNRTVFMTNLMEDFGADAVKEYANLFTTGEKKQIMLMSAYIKHHGVDQTRKDVTGGLEVVYDAGEVNDEA